jgi:hypothetical protein
MRGQGADKRGAEGRDRRWWVLVVVMMVCSRGGGAVSQQ